MTIRDQIAAARADAALSDAACRLRIAELKAVAVRAAAPAEPFTVSWTAKKVAYSVAVKSVLKVTGGVSIDMDVTRAGKVVHFNKPLVLINPPVLVEAEDGDIVKPVMRFDPATMKAFQIGERRLKEAPLLALRQMLREFVEALP